MSFQSIFELAANAPATASACGRAFHRIFQIRKGFAAASVGEELAAKYSLERQNEQQVVSVSNVALGEQTWYNTARTLKPQLFQSGQLGVVDPFADASSQCDFCRWRDLTAEDTFGRIETALCVTGSNLFKYCEPCHGIVLFKHHDPLVFSETAFRAAADAHKERHDDASLAGDMARAYASIGLLSLIGPPTDRVAVWPSISPIKDMEIVIVGSSLESASLAAALHAALRTLIDDFAVATFNVGVLNIPLEPGASLPAAATSPLGAALQGSPLMARVVSRGKLSSSASDFGGLEVFGKASIGHTDPFALQQALKTRLEPLLVDFECDDL